MGKRAPEVQALLTPGFGAAANMRPDSLLRQAYRETHYIIRSHPPVVLYIDQPSVQLLRLHEVWQVGCSTFITACNPRSELLDPAENQQRQARLAVTLTELGFPYVAGQGCHPSNQWPAEDSFWVPGMTAATGLTLAVRFSQNAIEYAGNNAIPTLLFCK